MLLCRETRHVEGSARAETQSPCRQTPCLGRNAVNGLSVDAFTLSVEALATAHLGEHSQQQVPQLGGDLGVLWEAQGLMLHHLE